MTRDKPSAWSIVAAIAGALAVLVIPVGAWVNLSNQMHSVSAKLDQYEKNTQRNIDRFYTDRFNPLVADVATLMGRVATLEAWISAQHGPKKDD